MAENPVKTLRKAAGLSRLDFAAICGCSPYTVRYVEAGNSSSLSERLRPGIERLGANFVDVQRAYREHKLGRAAEVIAKFTKGETK